ncbi:MAG TPA: glutamate synthase-related protein [Anaerolineales bacterium]|nr:glutamate synthase-related protein [Anaerolineales bacterium]
MSDPHSSYHRYHIDTGDAPDRVPWPSRFNVEVKRSGLAKLILTELVQYRGDPEIVLSRPCVYGVFSGPFGGFAPREEKCVGCLRCTTQYPEWVQVLPNPDRAALGDGYFTFDHVNAVAYEASTGRVPVRGAGYRGRFGGEGWDGMWTDMSEIVRPTRDGIHGREFISTEIDIGDKHNFLSFGADGQPAGPVPRVLSLPVPMLIDAPPPAVATDALYRLLAQAAAELDTLVMLPAHPILRLNLRGPHVVPLLAPADRDLVRVLPFHPRLVMLDGMDDALYSEVRERLPEALIGLRTPFIDGEQLLAHIANGIRIFHLTADYHGRDPEGVFVFDRIRRAHQTLVDARIREEVTLLGSGGIVAAEHVPKAIIAGLDAVVLDTPVLVALQACFDGDFTGPTLDTLRLPRNLDPAWGLRRLKNLFASWRDQLLEILGAMGLREVRRLRGEIGRAMFQRDLEREAFGEIEGYF